MIDPFQGRGEPSLSDTLDSIFEEERPSPVKSNRDTVAHSPQPARLEDVSVAEGKEKLLNPDAEPQEIINEVYGTIKARTKPGILAPTVDEYIDFYERNIDTEDAKRYLDKISREQLRVKAVVHEIERAQAEAMVDYNGVERAADIVSGFFPGNTIEDNYDLFNTAFRGDILGKMHDKMYSTDDQEERATILAGIVEWAGDMERGALNEILEAMKDPVNGREKLTSFFGPQGGGWVLLEAAELTPIGLLGKGAKGSTSFIKTKARAAMKAAEPVLDLVGVAPKAAKKELAAVASGQKVSPTLTREDAGLIADASLPDNPYKLGETLPLYDETISFKEKVRRTFKGMKDNSTFVREDLLDEALIEKFQNRPIEEFDQARQDLLNFLSESDLDLLPFEDLDKVAGSNLSYFLGDDAYSKLRAMKTNKPKIPRGFLSEQLDNVQISIKDLERSGPNLKVTYEIKGEDPDLVKEFTTERMFSIDEDTGELGEQIFGVFKELTASTSAKWTGNFREIAKKYIAIERIDSKLTNTFAEMFKQAWKPLGRTGIFSGNHKSMNKMAENFFDLDRVDVQLLDRAPTDEELLSGQVLLKNGDSLELKPMSENEIEAFRNTREILDEMHKLHDHEVIKTKELSGFVGINGDSGIAGGHGGVGKLVEEVGPAKAILSQEKVFVPHRSKSRLWELTEAQIDELFDQGYVLARMETDEVIEAGDKLKNIPAQSYNLAIVPRNSVTTLRAYHNNTVAYKTNYFPRVSDAHYWVREFYEEVVNGKTVLKSRAVAKADTMDDVLDWMESRKAEINFNPVKNKNSANFTRDQLRDVVKKNREMNDTGLIQEGGSPSVGRSVYTKARASAEIPYVGKFGDNAYIKPFDALARYTNNLAGIVPRNGLRQVIEKRWMDDLEKLWGDSKVTEGYNFNNAPIPETPKGDMLRKMRDQINEWNRIPTRDERFWQNKMQAMYEWMLKDVKDGDKYKPLLANNVIRPLRETDPIGFIRNVNFNMYLGLFNPVQWVVQAQQSAITAALHPEEWARGAFQVQWMLSNLDMAARGGKVSKKMTKNVRKVFGGGMSDKELQELWTAWNKTGFYDSVANTADFKTLNTGKAVTGSTLRNIAEKGQIFYRMGVLSEKRVNFVVAYMQWRKANPKATLNDAAISSIGRRAEEYSFEMGRAARANYQKGILSIPTQFLQIFTKSIENMLPAVRGKGSRNFTKQEAWQMAGGLFAIYGAAGVPVASMMTRYVRDVMQDGRYETPEEYRERLEYGWDDFVNNGISGYLAALATGFQGNYGTGERLSPLAGFDRYIEEAMFSEGFASTFLGASQSLLTRLSDAAKTYWDVALSSLVNREFPSTTDFLRVGHATLRTTSSWRNWSDAARIWWKQEVRSSTGKLLRSDVEAHEGFMKLLGVTSEDTLRIYRHEDLKRIRSEVYRGLTGSVREIMLSYLSRHDTMTEEQRSEMLDRVSFLLRSVKNPAKRSEIYRNAMKDMTGLSKEERMILSRPTDEIKNEIDRGIKSVFDFSQGAGE